MKANRSPRSTRRSTSGINLFDTAEVYGPFTNEVLVGKAIKGRRGQVVIATKFGFVFDEAGGSPAPTVARTTSRSGRRSLKRLGTDYIDLLYRHRVDPGIPIEDVVGVMLS